jgi:hypothetical protein
MISLGWKPPESLEEWSDTTQWNMGIDKVDVFPWMNEKDFREYVAFFKSSALGQVREPLMLERQ